MFAAWATRYFTIRKILWVDEQKIVLERSTSTADSLMLGYSSIFERLLDDVAFLWLQRRQAEDHPAYFPWDLAAMDERIQNYLRALLQAPDIAWSLFDASADVADAGYYFAAAILAFHSLNTKNIQKLVERAAESRECVLGVSSAMSCLPGTLVHPWIKKFLISREHHHQNLALLTCLTRREDPRAYLTVLIENSDNRVNEELFISALKIAGVLKRTDLVPLLREAFSDKRAAVRFWAAWSCALVGENSATSILHNLATSENEWQKEAFASLLLSLDIGQARALVDELARNDTTREQAIDGCALLGDASALPWLLQMAHVTELNPKATQAIVTITGITLENDWLISRPNSLEENGDALPLDAGDELPLVDPDKLLFAWRQDSSYWKAGARYFLGEPLHVDRLLKVYPQANQLHRRTAALHLAALLPDRPLLNHAHSEQFRL